MDLLKHGGPEKDRYRNIRVVNHYVLKRTVTRIYRKYTTVVLRSTVTRTNRVYTGVVLKRTVIGTYGVWTTVVLKRPVTKTCRMYSTVVPRRTVTRTYRMYTVVFRATPHRWLSSFRCTGCGTLGVWRRWSVTMVLVATGFGRATCGLDTSTVCFSVGGAPTVVKVCGYKLFGLGIPGWGSLLSSLLPWICWPRIAFWGTPCWWLCGPPRNWHTWGWSDCPLCIGWMDGFQHSTCMSGFPSSTSWPCGQTSGS